MRLIYDAFAPERMFWGTDNTRMPCWWRWCVTVFTEELPWLTGDDNKLIMGRALCLGGWIGNARDCQYSCGQVIYQKNFSEVALWT